MTSNIHSVQRGIAAVLAKTASALHQKPRHAVFVRPVFSLAQQKERASRRFGVVPTGTAHHIRKISKHSRDFGMHHMAIFPFIRWIRSISSTNSKRLPLLPTTTEFFLQRGLHQRRTNQANHWFDKSAYALRPLRNVKSSIADSDSDAEQPLFTLLTANPLEAVKRTVAAALDQPGCDGFMRFACRKEEAKA